MYGKCVPFFCTWPAMSGCSLWAMTPVIPMALEALPSEVTPDAPPAGAPPQSAPDLELSSSRSTDVSSG